MDKVSFFKLFLEFHSRYHMVHPYLYLSVKPYCICIESECFPNGQIDKLISFFKDHEVDFTYSCSYVHIGVRLIFTFKID